MSENVQDAIGPILQRIQAELSEIRATLSDHTLALRTIADEVQALKRMSKAALGTASGAELQAEDADHAARRANRRIDDLIAALKRREIDVDA